MGESLCRIFEFQSKKVRRINHLGDWGTQFGMLVAHMMEQYPDYLDSMPNLTDLETFYTQAKQKFKKDEEFKKKSQEFVVKLQAYDESVLKAWKILCSISKEYYKIIYKRLDISLEDYGESYYNEMIPGVIEELKSKKLTKMDQGALCMYLPKEKVPLMLIKSDGGYNYDTTDMAAVWFRLVKWKAQRVVYLTDVGQYPHFKKVFIAAGLAGWHKKGETQLDHMGFGLVLGKDHKKFSTSEGGTVKLLLLLDEAKSRAKKQLEERLKEHKSETQLEAKEINKASEILGISAIKYFDLKQNRI